MLEEPFPQQTIRYLSQILGEVGVRPGSGKQAAQLPYFLQDAYEVLHVELFGQSVVLACIKGQEPLSPKQLGQHAHRMHELLKDPVIMALPHIAPGERKQLIALGVAFVVPQRQLFAPRLGMILSERYAVQQRRAQAIVSPATQALLIWFLNHHPVTQTWHPFQEAATLGYTPMTVTRAVRELLQFDLFELELHGRAKHLKCMGTRRELWEKAKPHLRTPVQKILWTYDRRILKQKNRRWAGDSALARMTMVNDAPQQVIAMTPDAVQQALREGIYFEPKELADGIAVQVWRYDPGMENKKTTVDVLSLWLSLKDSTDDRVQMALDELEERFRW